MTLFESGVMGTVLICVICAVRAAALNRLPRRTFAVLWMLVVFRLLVPVSIPSPMSVYSLLTVQPSVPVSVSGTALTNAVPAASPIEAEDAAREASPAVPESDPARPIEVLPAVWWAGFLGCTAVSMGIYLRLLRRFAQSVPANAPAIQAFLQKHQLRRHLQVRYSDRIRTPLTYGILWPVILLPSSMDMSDTRNLNFVLMHEYMHVRHVDTLQKILLTAACCVYWWTPLVWVMYVLANRDMELACDESVIARCGEPAEYARMLIRLEEQKYTSVVPGLSSGARALKERILSVMKLKKKSVLTLVVAGALVAGVGTAFATNAPDPQAGSFARQITVVTVDSVQDQDAAAVEQNAPDVEWWTADEFEKWLENEKRELAGMLGAKGWTGSDGWFVWTQEKIDETIAFYEDMLEQIRAGVMISKTVDGSDDIMIMQGAALEDGDASLSEPLDPDALEEYARFGLISQPDGSLACEGEKIRLFMDSVELEPGITATKTVYMNDNGTACLRTVRRAAPNGDGSVDPFGELLGFERIPSEEAAEILSAVSSGGSEVTLLTVDAASEDAVDSADLEPYVPFGLSYQLSDDGLSMEYSGKPVHSLFDPVTHTWFADNMHGSALGDERVDLEAVYTDGRLSGLDEVPEQHTQRALTTYAESSRTESDVAAAYIEAAAAEDGTSFEELFEQYVEFGLSFEKAESGAGAGYNLYLDGRPVNRFSDIAPRGNAFSFDSAEQTAGGLDARVEYDGSRPVRIAAK